MRTRRARRLLSILKSKRRTVIGCAESKGKFAACRKWGRRTATARTSSRKSQACRKQLRGVARNLMRNHLHHCATKALRSGNREETEAMYDELLELIYAHLR